MIKLVVIDFDDTLCMTEGASFELENEIVQILGHKPMTRRQHQINWGKPIELAITERIPGIDVDEFMNLLGPTLKRYITEGKMDAITQANFQFLEDIRSSGRNLALLTSRTQTEVEHLLEPVHPINKHIEKIYYKGNSAFLKPDPRVFDKVLTDFGVKPSEAIYLGDYMGDATCAKGAGLHFVAVLESGLRTKDDFAGIAVDYFATTLPEAFSYISSVGI
jgi:phosphoglycolate phosphatase